MWNLLFLKLQSWKLSFSKFDPLLNLRRLWHWKSWFEVEFFIFMQDYYQLFSDLFVWQTPRPAASNNNNRDLHNLLAGKWESTKAVNMNWTFSSKVKGKYTFPTRFESKLCFSRNKILKMITSFKNLKTYIVLKVVAWVKA